MLEANRLENQRLQTRRALQMQIQEHSAQKQKEKSIDRYYANLQKSADHALIQQERDSRMAQIERQRNYYN